MQNCRSLLRLLAPALAAVSLAGCSLFTGAAPNVAGNVTSAIAGYAQSMSTGLSRLEPLVGGLYPAGSPLLAKLETAVDTVNADAAAITAAAASGTSSTTVSKLDGDVRAVIQIGTSIPGLPPQIAAILDSASVVLPVIESLAGLATKAGVTPVSPYALQHALDVLNGVV